MSIGYATFNLILNIELIRKLHNYWIIKQKNVKCGKLKIVWTDCMRIKLCIRQ